MTDQINHDRRRMIAGLGLFSLACGLSGCSVGGGFGLGSGSLGGGSGPQAAGKAGSVKVALLLPLTGAPSARPVAKAMKQAGELALFEFDNPNVQLIPKDTRGTPEGAKAAAQEAVREGAELIIGPLLANEVTAAAPVAQAAHIPMVAFSSDRKVAGNGVYLLSFLAGSDVGRIVSYALSKGKLRFAGLFPDNDYGKIVEQAFLESVQRYQGQVVLTKNFPPDANGMLAPVKEIAALAKKGETPQIDALFIPAGADSLPALAPLLPYFEFDKDAVKILGVSSWDFSGVGKEPALQGAWFSAADPKGWRDFTRRYVNTYSDPPPRLASLAYDAVSLAISLSGNPAGERFTPSELTRASGFAGVDGLFRLRPDGTCERGFAVLEVQRFGNQVIDPAPTAFTSAQY
jgi:ABC-type branched-subunit amino acid transport system substrate-binding protein